MAAALDLLAPDVVHLQAEPDTKLAMQAARLCGQQGRGLVIETEMNPAVATPSVFAARRARRTLARAHAAVARSPGALAALRRLGFDGLGVIAGSGLEPQPHPNATDARRLLHIADDTRLVIGWAGPLDTRAHIADLLEAVALCEIDVVVVIPAAGAFHQDVLDRADALEILHRVRFAAPQLAPNSAKRRRTALTDRPDLTAFPHLLAAADTLIVAPSNDAFDRAAILRTVELAHIHAIPVIHPDGRDIADLVGKGGWTAPFGDPALFARLFDALHACPKLLQTAAAAAAANAFTRHSPEAAAAELARALSAAAHPANRAAEGPVSLALLRQPGRT
jgi:glycosyltransferase involved in cell wall biosynthesis